MLNVVFKNKRQFNKTPTPGMKICQLNYCSRLFKKLPIPYRLPLLPLGDFQRWKVIYYCWRNHSHYTQDPEAPELKLT